VIWTFLAAVAGSLFTNVWVRCLYPRMRVRWLMWRASKRPPPVFDGPFARLVKEMYPPTAAAKFVRPFKYEPPKEKP
jgi:hypothetical protein